MFDQPKMWFSRNCSMDLNGFEHHWIGLRENLQETMDFTIKYGGVPVNVPLNQSIERSQLETKNKEKC